MGSKHRLSRRTSRQIQQQISGYGPKVARNGPQIFDEVIDTRTGDRATLPGPAPALGGAPGVDFSAADSSATGQVTELRVVTANGVDRSTPPQYLMLIEELSAYFEDAPAVTFLGTAAVDPSTVPRVFTARRWADAITENPSVGDTEVWELYNATGDAHPIHVHEVAFQVVNRQDIIVDEGARTVRVAPDSQPIPPAPGETGPRDTVIAYPGQVTRVRLKFEVAGQYTWHCHVVEHEEDEMTRRRRIGPEGLGQPSA